jgi:hypothetical protein
MLMKRSENRRNGYDTSAHTDAPVRIIKLLLIFRTMDDSSDTVPDSSINTMMPAAGRVLWSMGFSLSNGKKKQTL